MGRAARNVDGRVLMYADTVTPSMKRAIEETERRREVQIRYNQNTTLPLVEKGIRDRVEATIRGWPLHPFFADLPSDEKKRLIAELEKDMKKAADELNFEKAAQLRI